MDDVQAAISLLRDQGYLVLRRVQESESVANVTVLDEKHVLRCSADERRQGVWIEAWRG